MIDTHCHLLPGLDDGPPETAASDRARGRARGPGRDAGRSARPTSRAGTRSIARLRRRRFDRFDPSSSVAGIQLELHLGAEATPERVLQEPDDELRGRAIAGRFLLVEIVGSTALTTLELVRRRLAELDLTAVFGHPERCRAVQRHPEALPGAPRRGRARPDRRAEPDRALGAARRAARRSS